MAFLLKCKVSLVGMARLLGGGGGVVHHVCDKGCVVSSGCGVLLFAVLQMAPVSRLCEGGEVSNELELEEIPSGRCLCR